MKDPVYSCTEHAPFRPLRLEQLPVKHTETELQLYNESTIQYKQKMHEIFQMSLKSVFVFQAF